MRCVLLAQKRVACYQENSKVDSHDPNKPAKMQEALQYFSEADGILYRTIAGAALEQAAKRKRLRTCCPQVQPRGCGFHARTT
eukprot:s6785_g1.t1